MRKFIGAAALALAVGSAFPAQAAVNVGVAVPGSLVAGYATPVLILSKAVGTAQFVNLDIDDHDIRSDAVKGNGQPKFASDVIGTGEVSEIEGWQTLENGDYGFFCVVHTGMRGTATIQD